MDLILEELETIEESTVINDVNKLREIRELFSKKILEVINDRSLSSEENEKQYEFLEERNKVFLAVWGILPIKYKIKCNEALK